MASIILSATSLLENPKAGTVIGTLSVLGGKANESFTYTLADSLMERFEIKLNAATGLYELVVKNPALALFDYDAGQRAFTISVSATSNATSEPTTIDTTPFMINVLDNVAPSDIALSRASIPEHSGAGTVIGVLSATDANLNDLLSFTLLDDADGRFGIVDGKLVVQDGSKLDYVSAGSHQVRIQVTDSDNNSYVETMTIAVTDVLELRNGTSRNDTIYGGAGGELIYGRNGNDRIYGRGGNDKIDGGSGNDRIYGDDGDDIINGGTGKDILYGGSGKDTFVFNNPVQAGSYDQINDFNVADDTIQLSLSSLKTFKLKASVKDLIRSVFTGSDPYKKHYYTLDKVMAKGKLESKFFGKSYTPHDSNDYIYYNKKNGFVYFDPDGNGREKGIEIAKLAKGLALTANDFLMI
ncbi:calcium-binding protein [Microvirga sp. 2MCAF35]|uniref:calcium-binding protein n=1 Tax=Microvirga sp. 2MCAF35 TaxID=3232987 RepID=UPI003F99DC71